MEPVLFYGVPQGCSFGSIVALEWLGKPYRLCRMEMMEQPWDARFAKVNPRFKTPALLTEDDETLSESLAILLHAASRNPEHPLGVRHGSAEADRLHQMLSYLVSDFFAAFNPLWVLYDGAAGIGPLADKGVDASHQELLLTVARTDIAEQCAYLDGLLADRQWLLGERSVADAYLAGVGRWVAYHNRNYGLFELEGAYQNLAGYLRRLDDDPAVQFARAIERGEQPVGQGHFKGHVSLRELESRLVA
ncbi:glutathione S-transferase family protein [Billgrantia tianxiuensis]|jgi:glutathione S-transferase|uniref:Glutathione S-transferase family protein n=1 Tax=Billgrantia tianxiuensis TaxID=2497861 RepID=A0A6I6SR01_9GAMM|nr:MULTISPECIES: glutathione S-transferase family protein [Halomonas]MCE8033311.1 glutathione S-transferase family protein [Halomonas sp. MCCC 1A11057]QHC49043.1 glutathione S-transferase family protein [Halomonas tianxiuensis]